MIPYLFISGFLGAGKTTLLNNLLKQYSHLKIGVIVNDFGELAVDNMLITREHVAGEIVELRAGQIFCSCLSGKFVESVLAYETIKPDLLLVECSGLAKPATLSDIVQVINDKAPDSFDYAGMIALIDSTRHAVLEQSLKVVTEQIEASDMLLISKTEQLDDNQYHDLLSDLEQKYPEKTVRPIFKDRIEPDLLTMLQNEQKAYTDIDTASHTGWGELGRPTAFTLTPESMSLAKIIDTLRLFQDRWYRLKGTLSTSDLGFHYFDGVQKSFSVSESDSISECGLVVITQDLQLEQEMKEAFNIKFTNNTGLRPITLPA